MIAGNVVGAKNRAITGCNAGNVSMKAKRYITLIYALDLLELRLGKGENNG